jgi:hypothetical protein
VGRVVSNTCLGQGFNFKLDRFTYKLDSSHRITMRSSNVERVCQDFLLTLKMCRCLNKLCFKLRSHFKRFLAVSRVYKHIMYKCREPLLKGKAQYD